MRKVNSQVDSRFISSLTTAADNVLDAVISGCSKTAVLQLQVPDSSPRDIFSEHVGPFFSDMLVCGKHLPELEKLIHRGCCSDNNAQEVLLPKLLQITLP